MSISFNRNRTQMLYELYLGITRDQLENNKGLFKNHALYENEAFQMVKAAYEDAADYFSNCLQCILEGFDGIVQRRYSWATVKLYYSIFYALRVSLICNGYTLLQNGNIFRLKMKTGEKPFSTGNKKKYGNTHKGTINHYREVFAGSDNLLTNTIEDKDVYEWMEDIRNIVHYRSVSFLEPEKLNVWESIDEVQSKGHIGRLIESICNDNQLVYCFQPDFAVIAIPMVRLHETVDDIIKVGWDDIMTTASIDRYVFLADIAKKNMISEIVFNWAFGENGIKWKNHWRKELL